MTTPDSDSTTTLQPTTSEWAGTHSALLYSFALISGIAALLYQVVWVHMLTLTFGSTTVGAGVAIASFMAGLGIG
ncbi:MAG: hypothetical protein GF341_01675, partial [candidate division Zixibacteria bacterium]|nr:hypothetical protein [candidate division Zixibacteria bacterium]